MPRARNTGKRLIKKRGTSKKYIEIRKKKMKKKQYKITKSKLFKEQENNLPKKVKKALAEALKNIANNPEACPHSMSLFGPPSPEELKQWMGRVKPETIELVLEYLRDKDCLNKKGKVLGNGFWEKYIRGDKE